MSVEVQAAFARLHNACEPGEAYDADDMTVRQGDVRLLLREILRLREWLHWIAVDDSDAAAALRGEVPRGVGSPFPDEYGQYWP